MTKANPAPLPGVFERWAPKVLFLLTLALPLCFVLWMDDTFDLPKLTLIYLSVCLLTGLWAMQEYMGQAPNVRRTGLEWPIVAFLATLALSTYFSLDWRVSLFGSYKNYAFGFLPLTSCAAVFWFSAQVASPTLQRKLRTAALMAAAGVGLYALLQYTGHELFERMPLVKGGRVWSSMGNPIYVGAVCMMGFLLAASSLIQDGAWESLRGIAQFATLGLAGAGLTLSLSRSAWIGTVGGGVILWLLHRGPAERSRVFKLGGLILTIAVLSAVCLGNVRGRWREIASLKENSNVARMEGWKAGLRVWRSVPLIGSGPDTFFQSFRPYRSLAYVRSAGGSVTQADAHNDFVQIAATQGTLGLLAFLVLAIAFLRRLPAVIRVPGSAGFLAAMAGLILQNQFNFSSVSTTAWTAIWAGCLLGQCGTLTPIPGWRWRRWIALGMIPACGVGVWICLLPLRADLFYKRAMSDAENGQPMAALTDYREAARLLGHVEAYQTALANGARDVAQRSVDPVQKKAYFNEAWDAANLATRQHPFNPDAWNNRGVAAMWLTQLSNRELWKEARESFEKALALDPNFTDAWANLAKWEHLRGHLDEEKELWKKVLVIDPKHEMALRVLNGNK